MWYLIVSIPDLCTLTYFAQGHNAVSPVRLDPATPRSPVKHSTTEIEPLRSPFSVWYFRHYTRYKKLYLKSAFNFNLSNISHQGYFTDKQSERLYKYKHNKSQEIWVNITEIYIAIAQVFICKIQSYKDKIL